MAHLVRGCELFAGYGELLSWGHELGRERQFDREGGALAKLGCQVDLTTMLFNDPAASRETQSGPALLGGEERLEHARLHILGNPWTGVDHVDHGGRSEATGGDEDLTFFAFPLLDGLPRVEHQVQHDLLQVLPIDKDPRQRFVERRSQADADPNHLRLYEGHDLGQEFVQVLGLDIEFESPGEVEKVIEDVVHPPDRRLQRVHPATGSAPTVVIDHVAPGGHGVAVEIIPEQLQIDLHRRKRIADLVGESRRQTAKESHPAVLLPSLAHSGHYSHRTSTRYGLEPNTSITGRPLKCDTVVLPATEPADRDSAVRRASEILNAGGLVAIPTETVYGIAASADHPGAIARLRQIKGRESDKPFTTAFADAASALARANRVPAAAKRLVDRYWPGPLTLIVNAATTAASTGVDEPNATRDATTTIGLRVPGDRLCQDILAGVPNGVLLPSANPAAEAPALTSDEVHKYFDGQIEAIVDGGPAAMGAPSTIVEATGPKLRIVREGFLSPSEVQRTAATSILFVCSGNTCRSPMAEALMKSRLAEILGTTVAELPSTGFVVGSAGLYAGPGQPASSGAAHAMERRSIDLSAHRSRPLDLALLNQQDRVFAMTRSIVEGLSAAMPDPSILDLVRGDGLDVTDPFGGSDPVYEKCASELEVQIQRIASAITE